MKGRAPFVANRSGLGRRCFFPAAPRPQSRLPHRLGTQVVVPVGARTGAGGYGPAAERRFVGDASRTARRRFHSSSGRAVRQPPPRRHRPVPHFGRGRRHHDGLRPAPSPHRPTLIHAGEYADSGASWQPRPRSPFCWDSLLSPSQRPPGLPTGPESTSPPRTSSAVAESPSPASPSLESADAA